MSGFDDLAGEWKLPLLESFDDLQEVESVAFPIQTLPPTNSLFLRGSRQGSAGASGN